MTLAVTGATGGLGALVIDALVRRVPPIQVVALARDPDKAAPIAAKGVEVREFDYDRPSSLGDALIGVDRLLLISGNALGRRLPQHRAVIDAAVTGGVRRIAYTSVLGASYVANPVAVEHVQTEVYLAGRGVEHAALRNGWYNENYLQDLHTAAETGVIVTSAGQGRVASAARADYAEAAAIVLTAEKVAPVYELSGDVAWTHEDLAATFSEVLGAPIRVEHVSADEHLQRLVDAGEAEQTAAFLVALDGAIAAGELAIAAGELGTLIGRPTTPLIDTLRAGTQ